MTDLSGPRQAGTPFRRLEIRPPAIPAPADGDAEGHRSTAPARPAPLARALLPLPGVRPEARLRPLRLILKKPHRYRWYRAVTMSVTVAVLFAVPLLGLARVDLPGGRHLALGEPVDLTRGVVAVLVAIAAFYVVTFLVNLPAGRMFCGFGCPIGQLSRFADAIDAFPREASPRRRAWAELIAFALVLSLAVSLWWVAPAGLVDGVRGLAVIGGVLALAGVAVLHARRWRWGFCKGFCPIGLYYSVVQSNALVGIDFDPARTCTDCGVCRTICPVDLDPRRLEAMVSARGGLSLDSLPATNHCLHCGACVEACEQVTRKLDGTAALGLRRLRRVEPASPPP